MVEESNPIHIPDESELGKRIRTSVRSGEPIKVETGGRIFDVSVTAHKGVRKEPPTPEQVARARASILAASGSWKGLVDAEELKAYIRERRKTANRPPVEL